MLIRELPLHKLILMFMLHADTYKPTHPSTAYLHHVLQKNRTYTEATTWWQTHTWFIRKHIWKKIPAYFQAISTYIYIHLLQKENNKIMNGYLQRGVGLTLLYSAETLFSQLQLLLALSHGCRTLRLHGYYASSFFTPVFISRLPRRVCFPSCSLVVLCGPLTCE